MKRSNAWALSVPTFSPGGSPREAGLTSLVTKEWNKIHSSLWESSWKCKTFPKARQTTAFKFTKQEPLGKIKDQTREKIRGRNTCLVEPESWVCTRNSFSADCAVCRLQECFLWSMPTKSKLETPWSIFLICFSFNLLLYFNDLWVGCSHLSVRVIVYFYR